MHVASPHNYRAITINLTKVQSMRRFHSPECRMRDVYDVVDFCDASVVSAARAPLDGPHRPALVSLRRVSNEHMVITRLDK